MNCKILVSKNYAFQTSCRYGRLDIAKWLVDRGNTEFNYNDAFISARERGHLDVEEWLSTLGGHCIKYEKYLQHLNSIYGEED